MVTTQFNQMFAENENENENHSLIESFKITHGDKK